MRRGCCCRGAGPRAGGTAGGEAARHAWHKRTTVFDTRGGRREPWPQLLGFHAAERAGRWSRRSAQGRAPSSPAPDGPPSPPRFPPDQETNGKTSAASSNDFSDPIYKEIAITNGYINRMTREELRSKLAEFKLETRLFVNILIYL
uniref:Uncharacterized protein n=1 Tax=Corvus moneduloides TaxID=1196302 RepID=A0A8U7MUJ1_CORMO